MQLVATALRGVVRRGMVVRSLATAESIEWTKEALRRADAVCFDFAGRPASLYFVFLAFETGGVAVARRRRIARDDDV